MSDRKDFFVTENHEHVSSYTEMRVANILKSYNLEYVYSAELVTKDGRQLNPMFTIKSKKTGKNVILEYLESHDGARRVGIVMSRMLAYLEMGFEMNEDVIFITDLNGQFNDYDSARKAVERCLI